MFADGVSQPGRRRLLRDLQAEVAEVDAVVESVIRMSRAWSGPVPSSHGLAPVRDRVQALEAALGDSTVSASCRSQPSSGARRADASRTAQPHRVGGCNARIVQGQCGRPAAPP